MKRNSPFIILSLIGNVYVLNSLSLQSFTKKSSSRWEIAQTFPTLKKTYSMKNGHLSDWRRPPYSLVFWSAIWCSKLCKRARTSDIIFSWLRLFNELNTVNSDDLLKYMTPIILNNPIYNWLCSAYSKRTIADLCFDCSWLRKARRVVSSGIAASPSVIICLEVQTFLRWTLLKILPKKIAVVFKPFISAVILCKNVNFFL